MVEQILEHLQFLSTSIMALISSTTAAKAAPHRQIHVSLECCTAAGICPLIQIANSQVVADSRAQTDLNDGSSYTQMGGVRPHAASSAQLPTTRLRNLTSKTANRIPRTTQKEPEFDSDSEPEPTSYEIMQRIHPAETPAALSLVYDHERRQDSSPRPQPTTSDPSTLLRSAEMLALVITNDNGNTSAGDKLFMRVAKKAIEKALKIFYPGVVLGPIAMQMVMFALRAGWRISGTTLRALVYILRTVIPGVLVTIKDALAAEKTPEGSDHAPIPGAYPIMIEGPEAAAEAEATSIDHVEPKSAPRRAQPGAVRPQSRPTTLPEGPFLAERRASKKSPDPVSSMRCSPYSGLFRSEAERRAFRMSPYAQPSPLLAPINAVSRAPTYYPAPYPRAGWAKSPYNFQNPHGGGYIAAALRSKHQVPGDPDWREILDFKQRVTAFQTQMPSYQKSLAKVFDLSLTDVADFQCRQLICLGPYWARRLEPFMGADGKELPMLKLNADQVETCRALAREIDPRYYVQAAVMLCQDDGQLLVAMRLEVEPLLLTDDRGLVTAGSSDNGLTWDYVKATNERGDPTRVLYPAVETSDPMEIDGGDHRVSFLLKDDSAVKGSVVFDEDSSVSFLLKDGSAADVSTTDAHEADVSMADAYD